jgi:hypothetical protein
MVCEGVPVASLKLLLQQLKSSALTHSCSTAVAVTATAVAVRASEAQLLKLICIDFTAIACSCQEFAEIVAGLAAAASGTSKSCSWIVGCQMQAAYTLRCRVPAASWACEASDHSISSATPAAAGHHRSSKSVITAVANGVDASDAQCPPKASFRFRGTQGQWR